MLHNLTLHSICSFGILCNNCVLITYFHLHCCIFSSTAIQGHKESLWWVTQAGSAGASSWCHKIVAFLVSGILSVFLTLAFLVCMCASMFLLPISFPPSHNTSFCPPLYCFYFFYKVVACPDYRRQISASVIINRNMQQQKGLSCNKSHSNCFAKEHLRGLSHWWWGHS